MDLALWDQRYDDVAPGGSYMEYEWHCDFYFGYGFDVMEEKALNEKSCIQVLRILIAKANTEIPELEENLITLQSQIAWADETWSDMCSAALREKIDCLDTLIHSMNNTNAQDEYGLAVCLLLPREPAERLHEIVKALLESHYHQKEEQVIIHKEKPLNSIVSKGNSSPKPEKKDVSENGKDECSIIQDSSSDASGRENDYSGERKELSKFHMMIKGEDGFKKQTSASKERSEVLSSSLTPAPKGRILPKTLMPADHIVNLGSSPYQEESDVKPKVCKDPDSAPSNKIEPPLSALKIGKKRIKLLSRMKGPETGLTDTEHHAVDLLLELLNHKRAHITKQQSKEDQNRKAKLVANDDETDSKLPLKPQMPRIKREHQHQQKAKSDLSSAKERTVAPDVIADSVAQPQRKRKSETSPCLEKTKKLEGLQICVAELCDNTAESASMENLCMSESWFTGDPPSKTSKLLPSPILPFPGPIRLDRKCFSLGDLRAVAKQRKMKGYRKLTKAKLAEELGLNQMVSGGST